MPGQGKKDKVAEGDGGEAEPPPPDNRSWIQVSVLHWPWAKSPSLCSLWSSYSEGTEIKYRAATRLLAATDGLHVTPEHFAVCAEELDILNPSRPHGDCPPLSISNTHAFVERLTILCPVALCCIVCVLLYADVVLVRRANVFMLC